MLVYILSHETSKLCINLVNNILNYILNTLLFKSLKNLKNKNKICKYYYKK